MSFGLDGFKSSPLGQLIEPIVTDAQNVADMLAFSRHEMPAVQVIGKQLLRLGRPDIRDRHAKQMIGRWTKEIVGSHGWKPWRSRRVAPGNLFTMGMVYKRAEDF